MVKGGVRKSKNVKIRGRGKGEENQGVSVLMKNICSKRQIMIRFKVNAGSK